MHWTILLPASPDATSLACQLRAIRKQTRTPDCVQVWADSASDDVCNQLEQGLPASCQRLVSSKLPESGWLWSLQDGAVPLPEALEHLEQRAKKGGSDLMRLNVLNKMTGEETAVPKWVETQFAEPRNVRDEWWSKQLPCGDPLSAWVGTSDRMRTALEAGHDLPLQADALEHGMLVLSSRIAYRPAQTSDWSVRMEEDPLRAIHECEEWAETLSPPDREAWLSSVRERICRHHGDAFAAEMLAARRRFQRIVSSGSARVCWTVTGALRRWMQRKLEKRLNG